MTEVATQAPAVRAALVVLGGVMTQADISRRYGISKSTLNEQWMRHPYFPASLLRPDRLTAVGDVWLTAEVDAWVHAYRPQRNGVGIA